MLFLWIPIIHPYVNKNIVKSYVKKENYIISSALLFPIAVDIFLEYLSDSEIWRRCKSRKQPAQRLFFEKIIDEKCYTCWRSFVSIAFSCRQGDPGDTGWVGTRFSNKIFRPLVRQLRRSNYPFALKVSFSDRSSLLFSLPLSISLSFLLWLSLSYS